MPRQQKDASFDLLTQLHDSTALIAASARSLVGGVPVILDLGLSRVDARVILDISVLHVAAGDLFRWVVHVSNDATMTTPIFQAAQFTAGDVTVNDETVDNAVPRRQEIAFTNEINGNLYRYMALDGVVVASGAATYKAWLAAKA